MIPVGLRVDVDTLRGTRVGVPNLVALLARHRVRATFFFSVGPDNMGRHLWRLIRPGFLVKMLRTKAANLYGWDILLRGTLWPGPVIGARCDGVIRETARAGHEIGLHAWDHHRWQTRIGRWSRRAVHGEIRKGYDSLTEILGRAPDGFAAPAWRITAEALQVLDRFSFRFTSDCRGHSLFRPVIGGRRFRHVQVPTTLPTYDEIIGPACPPEKYNDHVLDLIRPGRLNVLTIHAEVEGIARRELFRDFLNEAKRRGIGFKPLGDIVSEAGEPLVSILERGTVSGREGWLARQAASSPASPSMIP